jgi:hypothetical protein
MRILIEASLPITCYLDEAVFWISFGCVPLAHQGTEYQEFRLSEEAAFDGGSELIGLDYPGALRAKGIDVDEQRFFSAPSEELEAYTVRRAHLRGIIAEIAKRGDAEKDGRPYAESLPEYDDETRNETEEIKWASELRSALDSDIDLGRARLFQELATGQLPAQGFLSHDQDSPDFTGHEPIPKETWKWARINWQLSVLSVNQALEYLNVQVRFDDLLKLYPRPARSPLEAHGVLAYGNCYIVDEDKNDLLGSSSQVGTARRRPGKPPKGALSARDVALNFYGKRINERRNGESEALIAEIRDFVKKSCNVIVSRSAVQEWISLGRSAMPEIAPVNSAGNPSPNNTNYRPE